MPTLPRVESGAGLAALVVASLDRRTHWELVARVPLNFPTHHPQGLAFAGEYIFLSSVQVLEDPLPLPDPGRRSPGRGVGHIFVLDRHGKLVRDIVLGEKDMYHPGGIDFDGDKIWVSVAEYRDESNSIILTIDPVSFQVSERFRVPDHIGWVVSDLENGVVHGGSWGSRKFYTWSPEGRELDNWDNPSGFIDYQDCQYAGAGRVICSGISILPLPPGDGDGEYELGGLAIIDLLKHRIIHETPIQLFSTAGHVVTRNPFALTAAPGGLFLHVAPDDGSEVNGTELLTYKAAVCNKGYLTKNYLLPGK